MAGRGAPSPLSDPKLFSMVGASIISGLVAAGLFQFVVGVPPRDGISGVLYLVFVGVLVGVLVLAIGNRILLTHNIDVEFIQGPIPFSRKMLVLGYEILLLLGSVVLLCVVAGAVTTVLNVHFGYTPFRSEATSFAAFLFYLDQAAKGAFADFVDVLNIPIFSDLQIDRARYYWFNITMIVFRWLCLFVLIGGIILVFRRLFLTPRV